MSRNGYICIETWARDDINVLHDREKQKQILSGYPRLTADMVAFDCVMRYVFFRVGHPDLCPDCDLPVESDWSYCPYCGGDLPEDINIVADTIAEVKRQYRAKMGDDMTDDECNDIKSKPYLKIWYEEQKDQK